MNYFCYFYLKLSKFFNSILVFLGVKPEVQESTFQEGELTVVGKDEVEIMLEGLPNVSYVDFGAEPLVTASCNPEEDTVSYCIKSDADCVFFLKIKWNVSSVRKVYWRVDF